MNGEVNRAYAYYKERTPDSILLFRVKDMYEAYFADADKIGLLFGGTQFKFETRPQTVSLQSDQIFDCLAFLGDAGVSARLIECRNDDGEFDIPDVSRLKREKEMDF